MAGKITERILRGKEAFELELKNEGDQSIYNFMANKYDVTEGTVKSYVSDYKKRVISPKPTKEELQLHEEIIKNKHSMAIKSSRIIEKVLDNIDQEFITDILDINYTKDLINYIIDSQYNVIEILKKIDSAIKFNDYLEEDLNKLNKTKEVIEINRKNINDKKIINNREKVTNKKNQKQIIEVCKILEQALNEGIENLDKIYLKGGMTRSAFDKVLPLLANSNEIEQTLYNQYYIELANQNELLEQNYLEMLYYFENGIEKNGSKTYYNILDYYQMTRLNPREFLRKGLKLIKDNIITRREYELISKFFSLYESAVRILSHEEALNYYYSLGGVTPTLEEKEFIIDYLENKLGIKLYNGVFECACDELLKGNLIKKSLSRV